MAALQILLLGSGGYRPNERRHTACVMLPEMGLVLDAGTAFFRVAEHLRGDELHVLLSHAHLDHVMGLTFLFDLLAARPQLKVRVYAEEEKLQTIERHLWYPGLFPARPHCELIPLSQELPSMAAVTYFPLVHPGGSVGYRLDFPAASVAYVTDTTADPDADYVRAIDQVDLLIHECYFDDEQEDLARMTGHSCTSAVAEVARRAHVGQLVLVHMNPLDPRDEPVDLALARSIFPKTLIGVDQMCVEL